MYFVKRLCRGVCSSLFNLSLFLLAISTAVVMVFGSPRVLKQSLAGSGVYNSAVTSALDTAQKDKSQQSSDVPLDRPEIKQAIQTAFTPGFVQSNTEQVINAVYDWLEGKTATPMFRIDLTDAKQRLTTSFADYAAGRAAALPPCTLQQLRELQGKDIDPFNVSCMLPGLTAETIRQKVTADVSKDDNFLKNTVITEANLPKNERGQTPFQQAQQAPGIYHTAKFVPYIFALFALLAAAGIILLSSERRRGIRSIGFSLISVGLIVFASTWLVNFGMNRLKASGGPFDKISSNAFQSNLLDLVSRITDALNSKLYMLCVIYIVLVIGVLITLKVTAPKQPETIPSETPQPPSQPEHEPPTDSSLKAPKDRSA